MTTTVLVTGGTGTLGRHVVRHLQGAGRNVRVLSRHSQPSEPGIEHVTADLLKGEGIAPAIKGVPTIIHCAGSAKGDDVATANLVQAASKSGASHLVYISVVGADRIPMTGAIDRAMFGYFGAKHAAEKIVTGSGLHWTMLRATQFHELFLTVAEQMSKLPLIPIPSGFRFQPIAADEVAQRLVNLALAEPAGLVPEMGGPDVHPMAGLIQSYLRNLGKRRLFVGLPIPGKAAASLRAGANLTPDRAVGKLGWDEFLRARKGTQ
jgi:uncharacterized protein YbjT (DUF2867 family)